MSQEQPTKSQRTLCSLQATRAHKPALGHSSPTCSQIWQDARFSDETDNCCKYYILRATYQSIIVAEHLQHSGAQPAHSFCCIQSCFFVESKCAANYTGNAKLSKYKWWTFAACHFRTDHQYSDRRLSIPWWLSLCQWTNCSFYLYFLWCTTELELVRPDNFTICDSRLDSCSSAPPLADCHLSYWNHCSIPKKLKWEHI